LVAETAEEREVRLEGLRAAQQERLAAETAEQRETRLEGPVCSCLWLDLTHSVYFLCDELPVQHSNQSPGLCRDLLDVIRPSKV